MASNRTVKRCPICRTRLWFDDEAMIEWCPKRAHYSKRVAKVPRKSKKQ